MHAPSLTDFLLTLQFFSGDSGARLSFREFSGVMLNHEEISTFSTVSTIRLLDDTVRLQHENQGKWRMV